MAVVDSDSEHWWRNAPPSLQRRPERIEEWQKWLTSVAQLLLFQTSQGTIARPVASEILENAMFETASALQQRNADVNAARWNSQLWDADPCFGKPIRCLSHTISER